MPFFKIKKLSPLLDGLIVEGREDVDGVKPCRILNPHVFQDDKKLSAPVRNECLWISEECLEEVTDPESREFATDNPWGACLFEGRLNRGNLEVAYAKFENATQVTVTEKQGERSKTMFAGYFLSDDMDFAEVQELIQSSLEEGDVDDLIFELKQLQAEEND